MAKGPRQRTSFRRRESGETDYRRRLKLLRSREMRAVVRVSNTRVTCQLVDWKSDGDRVILSCTGSDLVKRHGWPEDMSQKSVPASYLTGYALGKAAVTAGHDSAVLDIGLSASTSGSRVLQPSKEWSMRVWKFHMVMRYSPLMSESKETISMIKSQRVLNPLARK